MNDHTDIALLFARDPLKMTNEDIDALIAAMREKRHLFTSAPAAKGSKLTKKESEVADKLSLKLDLGL